MSAADTVQQAGNAAQALTSRFALPAGRREVVVGLAAQDVAKIYAQMARELAATVVQALVIAAR